MTSRQIEKDLLRTIPGHICFNNKRATGVPRMRRILRGLAWLYPDIGYCQVCIIIVVMDQIPQISGFQVPQSSIEFRLIEKKKLPSLLSEMFDSDISYQWYFSVQLVAVESFQL